MLLSCLSLECFGMLSTEARFWPEDGLTELCLLKLFTCSMAVFGGRV